MNFNQFVTKWNGKYCEFNNDQYKFQCVDLIRQYTKEVLGFSPYIAIPAGASAKIIFNNFTTNKYFTKILNSPTNSPKTGDIIFWGTYLFVTGLSGHTAICSNAGAMKFVSFDQNYPTGKPCIFVNHSYKGVLGWLSPKKQV